MCCRVQQYKRYRSVIVVHFSWHNKLLYRNTILYHGSYACMLATGRRLRSLLCAVRSTMNPRPPRYVSGKGREYRRRPRRHDADRSSGWRDTCKTMTSNHGHKRYRAVPAPHSSQFSQSGRLSDMRRWVFSLQNVYQVLAVSPISRRYPGNNSNVRHPDVGSTSYTFQEMLRAGPIVSPLCPRETPRPLPARLTTAVRSTNCCAVCFFGLCTAV